MTDPDVLTEVPAALKRLAKYVVRGFYGIEHALALDILIRNPCVKEEDMLELLKFDRKQLRAVLNTLKGDKFIKCRMRVETAPDGKTTRHNYYFINYRLLVNVVKYKLDHMRRRIETDERDSTNRASFKCPICFSTFTDLEANQLFDPRTVCSWFGECFGYCYCLPEDACKERAAAAGSGTAGLTGGHHREAWTTKGPSYEDLYTQNVVISMEDQEDLNQSASEGKPARERPIWLRESTVQGAYDPDEIKDGGRDLDAFQEREEGRAALDDNEEVMRALLIHEKKTPSASTVTVGGAAPLSGANASDSESETSESEEESPPRPAATATTTYGLEDDEEDEEFEVVAEDPTVMVAGRPHSYSQVSQRPELVAQMTPEEKEVYIAMGRRMFEDMFD
ncbi:general transcription factor IIE subunit 1 isoform X2 [Apteryx rowi]|uniref:general transcription factor IIE subunit 1 isoform X2 n=1 Tax=Apteryx rowi TaxID=308060 RepID=UPI000E1D6A4E|nr:general transcription factor IIE subunit 1 isoform X2 [Apteryx rowi]